MRSTRATATGVFFVVAAVAAIAGLALYQPALSDPGYVQGAGSDGSVLLGGFLEVLLAASCIGTAVTVFPVLRRQEESVALGYVCGRLLEAAVISLGIVATLSLVTLRQSGAADEGLVAAARALIAVHDWTFLLGPGLVIGVNSTLLAWLLRRGRLVPRWITTTGLVGGPLVFVSSTAVLAGLYDQVSTVAMLAAVPVFAWEMSLAGYLITRGFRPAASDYSGSSPTSVAPATSAASG